LGQKGSFEVVQSDQCVCLAALDQFLLIVKQVMVDEGFSESVADEGSRHLFKEVFIVAAEEEVEFVARFLVVDLQFFLLGVVAPRGEPLRQRNPLNFCIFHDVRQGHCGPGAAATDFLLLARPHLVDLARHRPASLVCLVE